MILESDDEDTPCCKPLYYCKPTVVAYLEPPKYN